MINIIRLIDVVVSIREMYECSERTFLYEWKKSHLSTVISCVIKRDGAYFRWIYDNYKSSVWRLSGDDYRPVRKSQGYILPKRPVQVDSDPLHIHAGLKSVASPRDRHGAGDGEKKREQKGPWRESRLFMTRVARAIRQSRSVWTAKGNAWSLISLFVLVPREFLGKIHFRYGRRTNAAGKLINCSVNRQFFTSRFIMYFNQYF